jgi:hypothetical protein
LTASATKLVALAWGDHCLQVESEFGREGEREAAPGCHAGPPVGLVCTTRGYEKSGAYARDKAGKEAGLSQSVNRLLIVILIIIAIEALSTRITIRITIRRV